jgi:hypothetical protein
MVARAQAPDSLSCHDYSLLDLRCDVVPIGNAMTIQPRSLPTRS